METMSGDFFRDLLGGSITGPDSLINAGGGPLPSLQGAPSQFHATTHAHINDRNRLLEGGLAPYAYGPSPLLINTQTQNAIPNKKQLVIAKLFLPAAQCDAGTAQDPILEHALSDGDVAFSLRMSSDMLSYASTYAIVPRGTGCRAAQLINLTTANYILWGLQVGSQLPGGSRWRLFFSQMCRMELSEFKGSYDQQAVFNFIQSYIMPYGIMHGSDTQGGLDEGNMDPFTGGSDYVSAFAIEGKIMHVMNLWRGHDVYEDDDLVLELKHMKPQAGSVTFNMCSSSRAQRVERVPVPTGWYYLDPVPLKFKTVVDRPHIHIGRSQKMISAYSANRFGMDMPPWDARACVLGIPVLMTFEPCFRMSDEMILARMTEGDSDDGEDMDTDASASGTTIVVESEKTQQGVAQGLSHTYSGKKQVNFAALAAPAPLAAPPLSSAAVAAAPSRPISMGPPPQKKQKQAMKVVSLETS